MNDQTRLLGVVAEPGGHGLNLRRGELDRPTIEGGLSLEALPDGVRSSAQRSAFSVVSSGRRETNSKSQRT